MPSRKASEECVELRREFYRALMRIFGEELGDANPSDLSQTTAFAKHAETCAGCELLSRELAKTIRVKFDRKFIPE